MFGINRLTQEIQRMQTDIQCLQAEIDGNTKELHKYADRGASILKNQIDSKSDISAIRHQMQMMEVELAEIQTVMGKYEDIFDAFLASRYEKDDAMKAVLSEFVARQSIIFDYMQSLEELLETTEVILEELKPEKKVPKLPKSPTATT